MGDSKQYSRILPNEYAFDIKIHFVSFFVKKKDKLFGVLMYH